MSASFVAKNVRVVLLAVCVLAPTLGCPPPADGQGEFEVLLVNGTDKNLSVFFNTPIQNHVVDQNNRIAVAPETVATARLSADNLNSLAAGAQLVVFVSAEAGGTPLAINDPQQVVPNPALGGQAAVLVTACAGTGDVQIADVAPDGF
jgi:hypothetical protein